MPDLDWNRRYWDAEYGWPGHGEEWSAPWGGAGAQWWGCIHPRLVAIAPSVLRAGRSACGTGAHVVEIAPGQGRWSRYLLDLCDQFTGFDIAPNTVAFCERWLADVGRAQRRFAVNNGADFPGVADGSVDLVFSFDSLVHAEQDVIDGYLDEIARVLRPDGRAFLHHSNLGLFAGSPGDNVHCRGETVSAESVRRAAQARRLSVVVQEMIAWQGDRCIDCLTTLRRSCAAAPPPRVFCNDGFWRDAARLKATIAPYHAEP